LPVPLDRGIHVPKRACKQLKLQARLVLVAWRSLHHFKTTEILNLFSFAGFHGFIILTMKDVAQKVYLTILYFLPFAKDRFIKLKELS